MKPNMKIVSVLGVGILAFLGYEFFKNQAGTNQNPSDSTYGTAGSTGHTATYITSYNFSDLFGSGQGTGQSALLSPSDAFAQMSVSSGQNTGFVAPIQTGFSGYNSNTGTYTTNQGGTNSLGQQVGQNIGGGYSPISPSGELLPQSTLAPSIPMSVTGSVPHVNPTIVLQPQTQAPTLFKLNSGLLNAFGGTGVASIFGGSKF